MESHVPVTISDRERSTNPTVFDQTHGDVQALRSHYNRLVGRYIEQEYGTGRVGSFADRQTLGDLEWMLTILDGAEDLDILVRHQTRYQIDNLLQDFQPPDQDILNLPDQNEF